VHVKRGLGALLDEVGWGGSNGTVWPGSGRLQRPRSAELAEETTHYGEDRGRQRDAQACTAEDRSQYEENEVESRRVPTGLLL